MSETREADTTESSWGGREVTALTRDGVDDVLEGRVAYLVIRSYLDEARCRSVVERFYASHGEVGEYGVMPTLQVGKPLMPVDREEYFARARELNAEVERLYEGFPNQATRVREDLERATGWKSLVLLEDGRPYCTSLVVSFPPGSHVPLHVDRSADIEGLGINRFPWQLSWNVYLQPAESGGDLVIYDRLFQKDEVEWTSEKHGGLHIDPALLERVTEVRFRTGDFILFDAARYHYVSRTSGAIDRVFHHGFISVDPALGELSFWT